MNFTASELLSKTVRIPSVWGDAQPYTVPPRYTNVAPPTLTQLQVAPRTLGITQLGVGVCAVGDVVR